ncbi:MAG: 4-hydroxythreonine-4-phosphate dehydrogenase PdxA, partial [Desulfobulbaceae bacterium]|nr:4-hydroxythreonine-4-phosphate dehydrogenase PdxA [Desulfobulbaceae bacterium]
MSDPSCLIGITMGCPVGIGPELILRFLSRPAAEGPFTPIVLGNLGVLKKCAHDLGLNPRLISWQPGRPVTPGAISVFDPSPGTTLPDPGKLVWGNPTIETGRAMAAYIEEAVNLILKGELAAMVTCPITKSALNAAGYTFPGHTEMIASICGSSDYAMMMAGDKLRVTLVTIHSSLSDVPDLLSLSTITKLIRITADSLRNDFGINGPRIAVTGLNPHAGEGGLFGDEEIRII